MSGSGRGTAWTSSMPTTMKINTTACSRIRFIAMVLIILLQGSLLYSQQLPPEVEIMGYADTVFVNGKVVSMDDRSASAQVGNVYQAVAVKGDSIMKLGTNDEVRGLAGRRTRVLDLDGRTLIPGIIETHQHIYGRSLRWLDRFGYEYPAVEVSVEAEPDLGAVET